MAGSTVSGIGSNIDTQAIVKALVDAQRAPKQAQIDTQSAKATTTLSSIGKIQAALDAFRGALTTMGADNSFSGLSATSSDEKVATVTMGKGASSGTYSLLVTQLASASKLSTRTFVDGPTSVVNAGTTATTLTISQSGKTSTSAFRRMRRCKKCAKASTRSSPPPASAPTSSPTPLARGWY